MEKAAQAAFDKAGASGDKATQRIASRMHEMARDAKADIAGIREASKAGIIDDATTARQINAVQQRLTTFSRRAQAALASIGTDDARGLAGELRNVDASMRTATITNARYAAEARGSATATRQLGQAASESVPRVTMFGRAFGVITALMAGFSVAHVVGGLFSLNSGLEQTRIAFTVMLGDAKLADTTLKSLFSFAETTPFMSNEVMAAARSLLAANVAAEDLEPTLRQIGDVASGVQMPLGELAAIYSKMKTDNRIMGDDLNQLGGRGVPVVAELAKVLGVAESAIRGMAEKGQIGFAQLEQAFKNMTGEGGRFHNLMALMSESTKGLVDSLVDVAGRFAQEITSTAFDALSDDIRKIRDRVNELRENGTMERWGQQAAEAFRTAYLYGRVFLGFLIQWGPALLKAAGMVAAVRIAVGTYTAVMTAGRTVMLTYRAAVLLGAAAKAVMLGNTTRATAAMTLFNVVVRANPIGLIITALTLAASAFILFGNEAEKAGQRTEAAMERAREAAEETRAAIIAASDARLNSMGRASQAEVRLIEADITDKENQIAGLRGRFPGMGNAGAVQEEIEGLETDLARLRTELVGARERLGIISEERGRRDEEPTVSAPAPAAGGAADTPDAPKGKTAEQLQDERDRIAEEDESLGEVVVSADRERAEAASLHQLEMRLELLDREREAAEAVTAAMEDGQTKSLRAGAEAVSFAMRELEIRRQIVTATENAGIAEAQQARTEALADVDQVAPANRAAARRAAEAEYQTAITNIQQQGELDRARLDSESEQVTRDITARGIADRERLQEQAYQRAQARTEEYWASDQRIRDEATQVQTNLDAGLITSLRDVAEARSALGKAYEIADTDEEIAEIVRLGLALDDLAGSMAATGSRDEATMIQDRLTAGLVASLRDVAEAKRVLDVAYDNANTDEERERVARLGAQLDKLAKKFKDVGDAAAKGLTGKLVDGLSEAADIAGRVAGLVGSMGAGDGMADAMEDVAGVLGSAGDLAGSIASGDIGGMVRGTIAVAQSIGTLVTGFGQRAEEESRNRQALSDATAATERNTRAMLRDEAVVGEGLSREDLAAARGGIDEAREEVAGVQEVLWGTQGMSEAEGATRRALTVASQNGVQTNDLEQQYADALLISDPDERRAALASVLDLLEARLDGLAANLGEFGAGLNGAIRRYSEAISMGGETAARAAAKFWQDIEALGLGELLAPMRGLVPGTPEWDAAVAAVWQQVEANPGLLPEGMSREELMQVLQLGGGGGSSQSGGIREVSQITSLQAGELLAYQQEQLRTQRGILSAVNDIAAGLVGVATATPVSVASDGAVVGGGPRGPLIINVPVDATAPLSEDEIERVTFRVGEKLRDPITYRRTS